MITETQIVDVDSSQWLATCLEHRARGLRGVDWLTAVDRGDAVEVLVHLVAPGSGDEVMVRTRVSTEEPRLETLSGEFPGADWHERETAEMFGIEFVDRATTDPLLLRAHDGEPPLLRRVPLLARVAQPWPGAEEQAGRRRRKLPPGVREEWVAEDE